MSYSRTTEARIDPGTGKVMVTVYSVPGIPEKAGDPDPFKRGDWGVVVNIGPYTSLKAARAALPAVEDALAFAYRQGRDDQVAADLRNQVPRPKPERLVVLNCPVCGGVRFEVQAGGERYRCLKCQALFEA